MVTIVVVIVCPIVYTGKEIVVIAAGGQVQLVLHVSEEAFLRRIVPAVGFPGHGLAQMIVPDNLNEFKACVVGALIAVDQGFCLQRNTMDFDQPIHCIKDWARKKRAGA